MTLMIEGEWVTDPSARRDTDDSGTYKRKSSSFRDRVTRDGSSGFQAEPGRYHLFSAPVCPWAHRTVLMCTFKKLENVISMSQAHLGWVQSWTFTEGLDEMQPEEDQFYLTQVYRAADPTYTGTVTVPVLWDRKTKTIVNNESAEIIRMLNTEFDDFTNVRHDYCPEDKKDERDDLNEIVYDKLNNGVYRAGFAATQDAYETAARDIFETLDMLEERLDHSRYLVGDQMTEADVRLFPTLIRFDVGYYGAFKCNLRRIEDYPNLSNYTRDIYQMPGVADEVYLEKIKQGYYNIPTAGPYSIYPIGPELDYDRPHDRAARSYS